MNRKTMKMLLTGKKPRYVPSRMRARWTIDWPNHAAMLNDSAIRAAFDQLRGVMFQVHGVPAHLMRHQNDHSTMVT